MWSGSKTPTCSSTTRPRPLRIARLTVHDLHKPRGIGIAEAARIKQGDELCCHCIQRIILALILCRLRRGFAFRLTGGTGLGQAMAERFCDGIVQALQDDAARA